MLGNKETLFSGVALIEVFTYNLDPLGNMKRVSSQQYAHVNMMYLHHQSAISQLYWPTLMMVPIGCNERVTFSFLEDCEGIKRTDHRKDRRTDKAAKPLTNNL